MSRPPFILGAQALSLALILTLAPAAARADAPTHEIKKAEPKVAAGAKGSAGLTIAGKNGWHVNGEAPITVSLVTKDAGVTVVKPKLTRTDLVESTQDAARFEIGFSCAEPGTKTITAEARFVMCQETACKPVKETLALNIEVVAAAAVKAPAKGKGKSKK